jgi:hypothetical protein
VMPSGRASATTTSSDTPPSSLRTVIGKLAGVPGWSSTPWGGA